YADPSPINKMANKTNPNWVRCVDFNNVAVQGQGRSEPRFHIRRNSEQHYDPHLLGMARSYLISIPNLNSLKDIFRLATICKDLNKTFSFSIARFSRKQSEMSLNQVVSTLDRRFQNSFNIYYACMVVFSKTYKVGRRSCLTGDVSQSAIGSRCAARINSIRRFSSPGRD